MVYFCLYFIGVFFNHWYIGRLAILCIGYCFTLTILLHFLDISNVSVEIK